MANARRIRWETDLGEAFRAFHAAAFIIIVAGVLLATYRRR